MLVVPRTESKRLLDTVVAQFDFLISANASVSTGA